MSSAVVTPDLVQDPKISERPVRLDFGHLHEERGHLLDLSLVARQMSERRHPSPEPFAFLKAGLAKLSSPAGPGSRFASFDVSTSQERGFIDLSNCTVTTDHVTWLVPNAAAGSKVAITDRLGLAAAKAIELARADPFKAIGQFFKMAPGADQPSMPPRDLFEKNVTDKQDMPTHYRERTMALAYAAAALNVHDYEPCRHPRRALELASIHSRRAAHSLEKMCGMGEGLRPERLPAPPKWNGEAWKPSQLPNRLQEALGWTSRANELSTQFAKRYALIVAEDILTRKKRWHT